MKTRFIQGLVMVALVVPFSSCPGTPQVALGVWLVTLDSGSIVGIDLGAGGMAEALDTLPPGATGFFAGTLSWSQVGSTFTMEQVLSPQNIIAYTGTVNTRRSIIDGTSMQIAAGGASSTTWTAMKL